MIKHKNKNSAGYMLVEILTAVSIISASVLASMAVAERSVYVSRQALHMTQANFLLEEGAEAIRIVRDNGWNNISGLSNGVSYYPTFSGGTWTLSATPSNIGIFTRTVTFSSVSRDSSTNDIAPSGPQDSGTRLVNVTLSWQEGGTTVTKTLQFYIANLFS